MLIIANATENQIAAIINSKLIIAKLNKKLHCNTTEILAPLIAMRCLHSDTNKRNICIMTDNTTAKSAYAWNRVQLQRKQLSFDLFVEIAKVHGFASSVAVEYVKSKNNAADYFSRVYFRNYIVENKRELTNTSLNELLQNIEIIHDIECIEFMVDHLRYQASS